jgi:ferredoxin
MRIVVDRDRCEGNGRCESVAPELFSVGDDEQVVVAEERPAERLREKVEAAIRLCPRQALRLEND